MHEKLRETSVELLCHLSFKVDTSIQYFILYFTCCYVFIFALSSSLGTHAVYLGISFWPSALASFHSLLCFDASFKIECRLNNRITFTAIKFRCFRSSN